MRIKKIVTLSDRSLLSFIKKKYPGLNKATHINIIEDKHKLKGGSRVELSWSEDEIIDGIVESK